MCLSTLQVGMPSDEPLDDESESVGTGSAAETAAMDDDEADEPTDAEESADPTESDGATGEPTDADESDGGDDESGGELEASEEGSEEDEEEFDPTSISNIERIVLDPDELVRSFAYNGQEEIGRKGKVVFSLTPPFTETVEPTLRHLEDDSRKSRSDGRSTSDRSDSSSMGGR